MLIIVATSITTPSQGPTTATETATQAPVVQAASGMPTVQIAAIGTT